MSKKYDSILEMIGGTPMLELHQFEKKVGTDAHILAKLEACNPSGSVKARIALRMVSAAEKSGDLKPGGTIVEGTSGNTGIGLSLVAAAKGYRCIICMPSNMSSERLTIMKSFGTEVILTPARDNMNGANEKARQLAETIPGAVLMNQNENPNNPDAHFATTGPEIWEQTGHSVDILVATTGTGGTISGSGHFLRLQNPQLEIIAVEPLGNAILNGGKPGPHKIQGIGGGSVIPKVTDTSLFNEVIDVSDENAYEFTRLLPKLEGLEIGISSGAALWAAAQVAVRAENRGKDIVVILPDGADRYLSGDLYR